MGLWVFFGLGVGIVTCWFTKTAVVALLPEVCATSVGASWVSVSNGYCLFTRSGLFPVPCCLRSHDSHCVEWAGPGSLPSLYSQYTEAAAREHNGLSALLATQYPHTPLELSLGFSSLCTCLNTFLSSQEGLFFLSKALGLGYPVFAYSAGWEPTHAVCLFLSDPFHGSGPNLMLFLPSYLVRLRDLSSALII